MTKATGDLAGFKICIILELETWKTLLNHAPPRLFVTGGDTDTLRNTHKLRAFVSRWLEIQTFAGESTPPSPAGGAL